MKDDRVNCDVCDGTGETLSRWTTELGGKRLRCPKCLGDGMIPRSELRNQRVERLLRTVRRESNRHPNDCRCMTCSTRRSRERKELLDELDRVVEARQQLLSNESDHPNQSDDVQQTSREPAESSGRQPSPPQGTGGRHTDDQRRRGRSSATDGGRRGQQRAEDLARQHIESYSESASVSGGAPPNLTSVEGGSTSGAGGKRLAVVTVLLIVGIGLIGLVFIGSPDVRGQFAHWMSELKRSSPSSGPVVARATVLPAKTAISLPTVAAANPTAKPMPTATLTSTPTPLPEPTATQPPSPTPTVADLKLGNL